MREKISSPLKTAAAFAVMLVTFFFSGICVFGYSGNVYDEIGLLTPQQLENVREYASDISAKTGWNIDVYITDCGYEDDDYVMDRLHDLCDSLYKRNHGYYDDGILFLCDKEWVYICSFGYCAEKMSERRADSIAKLGNDYYKTDPEKSINLVLDGIYDYYAYGMAQDEENARITAIVFGIPAALIAVLITVLVIRYRYKLHEVPDTNMYLDHHTLRYDRKSDTFVREYVTRTTNSSSGGHGGSHHSSVGGGSHR